MKPISEPALNPAAPEVQRYGTTVKRPIGIQHAEPVVEMLNQILADALTLRDLYKKHHWQASGPTFYQLHLLFDKHHQQLEELVDLIAERIQILGGVSVAMGADASELTSIPPPPRGRETPAAQIERLLAAHKILIRGVREGAKLAANHGDDGSNDLLIGGALRTNEMQVWFLSEHLGGTPTSDGA
jgi:starvation-inducible DNA-binding protein